MFFINNTYKMKKSLSLLMMLLLIMSIISCSKDSEKDIEIEVEEESTNIPRYQLSVSSDTLIFYNDEVKEVLLTTLPIRKTSYKVINFPNWIEVSPESGQINRNLSEIIISSKLSSLIPGTYNGDIEIFSTEGKAKIHVIGYSEENTLYEIPNFITVEENANNTNITITNIGNTVFEYSLSFDDDILTTQTTSGTLDINEHKDIIISVNRDNIKTREYISKINLIINGIEESIDVLVNSFIENNIYLQSDVIDCEYSKVKDVLVYISSTPMSLNIFDAATEEISTINLDYTPTSISISPDGNSAVVGHDARITHIDLNNKVILNTYSVSCYVNDIVLSNDSYAYLFPKSYNWTEIISVDLSINEDNETKSQYIIHGNTKAKLHPSGKYIYGADNNVSPSDIEKYDIQSGTAEYLYDSPYHGDYPVSGDLWLSEDGLRIFTAGRTVFKTNELKDYDMLYNGIINIEGDYPSIHWLDHSEINNSLYMVISTYDYFSRTILPYIYVHNANNLIYREKYEMDRLLIDNIFYNAEPNFVFSTSNGESLFSLNKAIDSGLINEWAIQKIDIK